MQHTILVTGGNRGIGKAICSGLANQAINVLLGCRDLENGQIIASQMSGSVTAVELDLSDSTTLLHNLEHIQDKFPCIDGVVNNAAILAAGDGMDLDPQDMMDSILVNLWLLYN